MIDADNAYQKLIDLQDVEIAELKQYIAELQMQNSSDPKREAIALEAGNAATEIIAKKVLAWLKGEETGGTYGSPELQQARVSVLHLVNFSNDIVKACEGGEADMSIERVLVKYGFRKCTHWSTTGHAEGEKCIICGCILTEAELRRLRPHEYEGDDAG